MNELSAGSYDSPEAFPKPCLPELRQHLTKQEQQPAPRSLMALWRLLFLSESQVKDLGTTSLCELWLESHWRKASSTPLYVLYVADASYRRTQMQVLVLAFLQVFLEEHFATSAPFTDKGGMGWQSQKYEPMYQKKMDKALWYEHPPQKSFWPTQPQPILTFRPSPMSCIIFAIFIV